MHTAIAALDTLVREHGRKEVTLSIAGSTSDVRYLAELESWIAARDLQGRTRFLGMLDRHELIRAYGEHDIQLFPSIWEEPFGIVRLEAMASGLPVVSTRTGAAEEVHQHGETGLFFTAEDPESCAREVLRLLDEPDLFGGIRERSRQEIEERYQLGRVMDSLESLLFEAATGRGQTPRC